MVSLPQIQSSNSQIPSTLPAGLVAVFAGATAGIGETCLKEFARDAVKPRIYFIGRSQEAGDRLDGELKALNPEGEYVFLKADTSLLRNVDEVCGEIKRREGPEGVVNVLFLSQGTLKFGVDTPEGLHYLMALTYYSRTRFIVNLLPLIQRAPALRRVITVMAGGKEGRIYSDDFQARKIPLTAGRGHLCTMLTLSLEVLAKKAPEVSFIHNFPGAVKTNLIRGDEGFMMQVVKYAFKVTSVVMTTVPLKECGERHTFLCTSAKYPPAKDEQTAGVPLASGVKVARGSDGRSASGVYTVDGEGESSGPKVEELLANYRQEGIAEKLWKHTEGEFKRITGCDSI